MTKADSELRAQPTDVFRVLAHGFGRAERDIALYARFLREGSQNADEAWPAISAGRRAKFEVAPRHAIMLLLALATSSSARTCADPAEAHASLTAEINGDPVTLASFLASCLAGRDAELTLNFSPPWAVVDIEWQPVAPRTGRPYISANANLIQFRDFGINAFGFDTWFQRTSAVKIPMLWELCSVFYSPTEIAEMGRTGSPPWKPGQAHKRELIPAKRSSIKAPATDGKA